MHNITPALKKLAIEEAKRLKQKAIYVTSDGYIYSEAQEADCNYHCNTNGATAWLVEVPATTIAEPLATDDTELPELPAEETNYTTTELTSDIEAHMAEAAKSVNPTLSEEVKALVGVPQEKLVAMTKEKLVAVATELQIATADTDVKAVIATAIYQSLNPTV